MESLRYHSQSIDQSLTESTIVKVLGQYHIVLLLPQLLEEVSLGERMLALEGECVTEMGCHLRIMISEICTNNRTCIFRESKCRLFQNPTEDWKIGIPKSDVADFSCDSVCFTTTTCVNSHQPTQFVLPESRKKTLYEKTWTHRNDSRHIITRASENVPDISWKCQHYSIRRKFYFPVITIIAIQFNLPGDFVFHISKASLFASMWTTFDYNKYLNWKKNIVFQVLLKWNSIVIAILNSRSGCGKNI